MRKRKFIFVVIFTVCGVLNMRAQTDEDNIIVTNQTFSYTFEQENDAVVVNEENVLNYECTKYGSSYVFKEAFDSKTKLFDINRQRKYSSAPEYAPYTSDNMFYTDMNICSINLRFERKGFTNELKYKKQYLDPRYFTMIPLSSDLFIKAGEVVVTVPKWMNVELIEHNFGTNITKKVSLDNKTQATIYTYHIANQAADVAEGSMRGYTQIYPHIQVICKWATVNGKKTTYFETLDDQYAWYHDIIKGVNNDMTIIKAKADDIVKDCKTDEERAKTIFAWVQDNIRYIAFEDGLAGFKPDDAQEVLRKKYGDCKGMANLTKALLVSEGFDARLAWLGTNHIAYDYTTPSLANDNHMICALYLNGNTYYLDATVKYMPLGEYPHHIQGRQTLVEDKDNSKYLLNRIPIFPPKLNTDSLFSEVSIVDGVQKIKAEHHYKGESKQILLSLIDNTPKDKQGGALKIFLEKGTSRNVATNIITDGVSSQSQELKINYELERKDGVQIVGNEYYIDLDMDKALSTSIDIDERVNDIDILYNYYFVQQTILNIPQGYTITSVPEGLNVKRDGYNFSIEYAKQGDKLVYKRLIEVSADYLPKSLFAQWNEDISSLRKAYTEQITLTKQQ